MTFKLVKPRAFVIMPFGVKEVTDKDGKPAGLVDFNLLYNELIAPALEAAGCKPFRADLETAAGNIRTDMYYEILTADLVVADLSALNANVYYELGIRHAVTPGGTITIHGGWAFNRSMC